MNNSVLMAPNTVLRPEFVNPSDSFIEEVEFEEVNYNSHQSDFVPSNVNFLESNTDAITLEELTNTCIVPTYADQTLTISHQDFINTVVDAAKDFYQGESFRTPTIRVSHEIQGRVPTALHKPKNELLESDKTHYHQRLAFAFTIPTIYETIEGQRMELCIGGTRNYHDYALYRAAKGLEKFSVFVGWRVNVCSNQVLTGDGLKYQMEVSNLNDLYRQCLMLFNQYNPAKDLHLMQTLTSTRITESQFAQVIGRCRMYQALPQTYQRYVPQLLITDSQINNAVKGFFNNSGFRAKDGSISMWNFHNLLTEANKQTSYIDSYLSRAVNATEVSVGINNAITGIDNRYDWFLN